jgi:hypothetical protein
VEEGYEEVWDEVQEALSTLVHEDYDESQVSWLTTRQSLHKVSSVATLFIIIRPSVSAVLGCF